MGLTGPKGDKGEKGDPGTVDKDWLKALEKRLGAAVKPQLLLGWGARATHAKLGDVTPGQHHASFVQADADLLYEVLGNVVAHTDSKHTDSGEHILRDGTVPFTGTVGGINPVAAPDLATKEYVDSAIHFIADYFFNDTQSSYYNGGEYYKMLDTPTGEAESTFQSGLLGEGDDQGLFFFATDAGAPGVTVLEAGVYTGHIHARVTVLNKRPTKIHFKVYFRTNGAETLVVTSEETAFLTDSNTEYNLHATLAADVTIATTDRLIIKWFANVDSTPANDAVVELFAEGTNASRFEVPVTTDVLNQIFVRQDGTKPLTANWAVGSKKLTGLAAGSGAGDSVRYEQLHAQTHGAGQHSETKVLHAVQFVTAAEDATVETMLALPAACIGESGEMGTVTGVRFKVFLGTAGVTGTMTVKLYADSASNFPSETEIATVDITTGIEGDDTTITSWVPGTDNFLRAKITAIHSGTAAKNVACVFYYEVTLHA